MKTASDDSWTALEPTAGAVWKISLGPGDTRDIDADALRAMKANGVVNDNTLVWRAGMTKWVPLGSIAELDSSSPSDSQPAPAPPPGPLPAPSLPPVRESPKAASRSPGSSMRPPRPGSSYSKAPAAPDLVVAKAPVAPASLGAPLPPPPMQSIHSTLPPPEVAPKGSLPPPSPPPLLRASPRPPSRSASPPAVQHRGPPGPAEMPSDTRTAPLPATLLPKLPLPPAVGPLPLVPSLPSASTSQKPGLSSPRAPSAPSPSASQKPSLPPPRAPSAPPSPMSDELPSLDAALVSVDDEVESLASNEPVDRQLPSLDSVLESVNDEVEHSTVIEPVDRRVLVRWSVGLFLGLWVVVTLYRHDLVYDLAKSVGFGSLYRKADAAVLNGPDYGTPRSIAVLVAKHPLDDTPIALPAAVQREYQRERKAANTKQNSAPTAP